MRSMTTGCVMACLLTVFVRQAVAQEWVVELSQAGSKVEAVLSGGVAAEATNRITEHTKLTIKCNSPVSCKDVRVQLNSGDRKNAELGPEAVNNRELQYTWSDPAILNVVRVSDRLVVLYGPDDNNRAPIVTIQIDTAAQPTLTSVGGEASPTSSQIPLTEALVRSCVREVAAAGNSLPFLYEARANRAHVVVSPLGQVYLAELAGLDEDDDLVVHVVGDPSVLPRLKVVRSSQIRPLGNISIVGGEVDLAAIERFRRQAEAGKLPPCGAQSFVLRDFAPGRGEVEISAVREDGSEQITGRFDFNVHRLYTGAFTLGVIRTELLDPKFGLTPDSIITVVEDGKDATHRILYALYYTPFIWGRRDLEKPRSLLDLRNLNPTIGLVLNDISDNFLAGVSYDLVSSIYVSFGAHFARVQALDPNATAPGMPSTPLKPGVKFAGDEEDIPTVRDWDVDFFVGIAVDIRAAVQLLQKGVGSGGTS